MPVSVSDVWAMFQWFHSRKAANKDAVVEWLEAVNRDLESLSHVWMEILHDKDMPQARAEAMFMGVASQYPIKHLSIQALTGARLTNFYQSASRVLGGSSKAKEWHEPFVFALAEVLQQRRRARKLIDGHYQIDVLDPTSEMLFRKDMQAAAEGLQKEIAALQVLIATFKAAD